jgi:hypothetical protein
MRIKKKSKYKLKIRENNIKISKIKSILKLSKKSKK